MQTKLKKILLAALPVAGLLFTAPAVFAHGNDYQGRSSNRYERYHDRHQDLHDDRRWSDRRAWHRRHNNQNSYWNRRYSDWNRPHSYQNRRYSDRYLGGYNNGEGYDSFWDRRADEWN